MKKSLVFIIVVFVFSNFYSQCVCNIKVQGENENGVMFELELERDTVLRSMASGEICLDSTAYDLLKDQEVRDFRFFDIDFIYTYRKPQFTRVTRRLKDYCSKELLILELRY